MLPRFILALFGGALPHKEGENQLTYSLGDGVKALYGQSNADYAAFLTNRTLIPIGSKTSYQNPGL